MTGDFIGNYASGSSYAYGGAIYNRNGIIRNITGDFIGNYASGSSRASYGGAIYNYGQTIGEITGDFIGNYASGSSYAYGGAIYNYGKTIGEITGDFINNYAESTTGTAQGGAIYTNKSLKIKADKDTSLFSGNYVKDKNGTRPEAIYVDSKNATLTLNSINNGTIRFDDQINGVKGYTLNLTGDGSGTVSLYNDVINSNLKTDNVTVDFANGETKDYSFVSVNAGENTKLNIDVDLTNAKADTITTNNSTGTLIVNSVNTTGSSNNAITVQIIKNTNPSSNLELALGDNFVAVENILDSLTDSVDSTTKFYQQGGINLSTTDTKNDSLTIYQDKLYDTLSVLNDKVTNNNRNFNFTDSTTYILTEDLLATTEGTLNINGLSAETPSTLDAAGHTLFNLSNATTLNINNTTIENAKDYAIKATNDNANLNLTNTSIKNTTTENAAIQSDIDVNITADKGKSEFSGNGTAIWLNNPDKTLTLNAINDGSIIFDDDIKGQKGYKVNITGTETGSVTFNKKVDNATVNSENVTVNLTTDNTFESSDFTIKSGTLNLVNDSAQNQIAQNFTITGNINVNVDADLGADVPAMDRLPENTTITNNGIINVDKINLTSDAQNQITKIPFAYDSFKGSVVYDPQQLSNETQVTNIFAPIYKYDVSYNPEDGFFTFVRGAGSSHTDFNPAVTTPAVATQAGAYTTQMQTFNYAFHHADTFMNIPYLERIAIKNQYKYALSPTGDATDVGTFSPLLIKDQTAGFWVKPYASFESIPLKNGPKVSNINYGTLVGYDSELQSVKYGWDRVLTGYIGYNGASQRYSGIDTTQNGGILGTTVTMYKGNFFNATTLSVGASSGNTTNAYGSENYTMLLAGIGNKIGYNFEFKEGKYIIQPSMLLSYTFVNTFDYTNSQGVRLESDPLHAIQLAPGIKFIMNTKTGWQPYIGVNMVWNLLDKSEVRANDVRLPEMSIKPYVQYGVGVQKLIKDRFVAYGQAMIHNGGRNGISLTAGFRWKVGREVK